MVTLRHPGGSFGNAAEPNGSAIASDIKLGVDCDGSVTLVWQGRYGNPSVTGLWTSELPGTGAMSTGACDGQLGTGSWTAPSLLSKDPGVSLPDLAVSDAGAALVVWQEGTRDIRPRLRQPTDLRVAAGSGRR